MKNGRYKNDSAVFFVKDGKVLALINGRWFCTTTNFMIGVQFVGDLTPEQIDNFEAAHAAADVW